MVAIKALISFGERVANARRNQGISQERLGEMMGYSQSIVSRQENGKLVFSPVDAARAARVLNSPGLLEQYCSDCPAAKAYKELNRREPA